MSVVLEDFQPAPPSSTLRWVDRLSSLTATICALHCALVPVLFALVPALRLALHSFNADYRDLAIWLLWSMRFERTLIVVVSVLTVLTLVLHRAGPKAWLLRTTGIALMLSAAFLLPAQSAIEHAALLALGSALLWVPAHRAHR
jgi:hypothetical protein